MIQVGDSVTTYSGDIAKVKSISNGIYHCELTKVEYSATGQPMLKHYLCEFTKEHLTKLMNSFNPK